MSNEISEKDMLRRIEVEIEKYVRLCPTCYFFGEDGTCDMCDAGGWAVIDNNGKRPTEVQDCNVYTLKERKCRCCGKLS